MKWYQGEDTPCHLATELSKETVSRLTGTQAKEFAKVICILIYFITNSNLQDNIFAVERLDARKVERGKTYFLVIIFFYILILI